MKRFLLQNCLKKECYVFALICVLKGYSCIFLQNSYMANLSNSKFSEMFLHHHINQSAMLIIIILPENKNYQCPIGIDKNFVYGKM